MLCAEAVYRLAMRFCILVVVGLCAACAALRDAYASELIYSPWEKFHISGSTSTRIAIRLASDCKPPVATVELIERTGESKKTLRVSFPNQFRLDAVRIGVDQRPPVRRKFGECRPLGCSADYEAGAELVDQLKGGTLLMIEVMSAAEVPMIYRPPLAGFAQTYDAPPPRARAPEFVAAPKKLQEELERRARGESAETNLPTLRPLCDDQ